MTRRARSGHVLATTGLATGLAVAAAILASASGPGVTAADNVNLSTSAASSERPRIAVTRDGTIHVVWEEGTNIAHRYRAASASDWSPTSYVHFQGYEPAIATDGRTVVVAYVSGKRDAEDDTEIYYKIWNTDTRSWPWRAEQVQSGSTSIAVGGQQPDVALSPDGSSLWLTWISTAWGEQQPYYARIRLGDRHVEAAAVDPQSRRAQGPVIAIAPEGHVHIVWSEQSDLKKTATIYHASRLEGDGVPWEIERGLYLEVRQARAPDLAASPSQLCIVWHENISRLVNGTPEPNNEIALRCHREEWNISNSPSHSLVPSLSLDDVRGPMVLWRENLSPREILFRQGPPPPANAGAAVGEGQVDMPAMYYTDGLAHGVWSMEVAGAHDVFYARWPVAVPTPTPTAPPTATPTASRTPRTRHELYCPYAALNG